MITEYGEVMLDILDEWGFRRTDGLLEDGRIIITVTVGVTYVNVDDSGSGADQLYSLLATLTLAESASGTDGSDMQAALPLTDSGVGSDVLQSICLPLTDGGSGADAPTLQGQLSLSDVGAGLDSPSMQGQISLSDAGNGADIGSLQGQLTLADSGVGADVLSQLQAQLPVSDAGLGSDVLQSIGIPVSEVGSGDDVPTLQGQLTLTDEGLGAELFGLQASLTLADVGYGVDLPSLLAELLLADSGLASETLSLQALLSLLESGFGADGASVYTGPISVNVGDSGVGCDIVRAACLVEAPQVIVTADGKIILRVSLATKDKPQYIVLG